MDTAAYGQVPQRPVASAMPAMPAAPAAPAGYVYGHAQPVAPVYQAPVQTSGKAIASLVLGIVSLVGGWVLNIMLPFFSGAFLLAVPAVILGHIALADIRRRPDLGGQGLAITGLVMGYIVIAFAVFALIMIAMFFSWLASW